MHGRFASIAPRVSVAHAIGGAGGGAEGTFSLNVWGGWMVNHPGPQQLKKRQMMSINPYLRSGLS